jgi:ribosomal protein S18 acetylase RimI-like enzyme
MKVLVNHCFPITYKDEFYERVARAYADYTRFVAVNDVIVGGISARMEEDEKTQETHLHVLILLVFHRYRRTGLAAKMLAWLVAEARKNPSLAYLSLHVQKSNEAAVKFYLSQGFHVAEEVPGYYTDIESPDALFLKMLLTSNDKSK